MPHDSLQIKNKCHVYTFIWFCSVKMRLVMEFVTNNFSWKNLFNQPPTQTYPNKNIRSHCAIFNTRLRFTSFRLFFRACFFLSEMSTGENAPKFGTSNNRQIWESSSKIGWKVDHTKITKTILSLYFSVLKNGSKMCSPCEVCEHDVKTNDARLWMPQQSNKRL